jgi:hypothetical protein
MKSFLAGLIALGWPWALALAQPSVAAAPPAVTINLGARHGHVTPTRQGFTHTGGGNLDVAQPAPDTLVVTMTGVAVAGGHPCKDSVATLQFDLEQCLEIASDNPKVKRVKVTLEGRVIGLLRSHRKGGGAAEQAKACAALTAGPSEVLGLCVPPHGVAAGENLSLNCREGPVSVSVAPGAYVLHQAFTITASHPKAVLPCKAASAEFAPDPALDPLWISYWEPFHGAAKKDFGFQVTIKVAADSEQAGTEQPRAEPSPGKP